MTAEEIIESLACSVIASHPVGAKRRRMTGSAKQSISPQVERMDCFVASLLAMTGVNGSSQGVEVQP
ncbi:hypothetical protein UP09_13315 [Bradyrhizobium sp. LTSP885]|uniref:hypothetical protein n=1 Tax=Bradyrhizobium sp. LTSP885 TaxID=1619232 RepID=UPI0005C81C7D|nr:hypothetical protein [Bradyrhizobium sp. LTSP885]KJC45841.1 hypothetical protein UP09_13315 [Bradyrhizobium sp. LTSP885]